MQTEVSLILGEGLLFELQGREGQILSTGIEAGTVLLDPGKVTMAKDLGIGIVNLQGAEQCHEGVLLGRGTGVGGLAIGIETSLIADADTVGVVATGVGTNHLLGAALVQLAVLGDVVMVARGLKAPTLVACLEVLGRKVLGDFRGGAMDNNQVYSSHFTQIVLMSHRD